ncbi:MAG: hypothetical protein KAY65_04525 [Planctomycetes bacterium]|nr:hypothetical protein [Planctomycetota bacterium]
MSDEIAVWTESSFEIRGALPGKMAGKGLAAMINTEIFSENLKGFLKKMATILSEADIDESRYEIDCVELSLAVNASGGIELLGKVSAGTEASLKITLMRKRS